MPNNLVPIAGGSWKIPEDNQCPIQRWIPHPKEQYVRCKFPKGHEGYHTAWISGTDYELSWK